VKVTEKQLAEAIASPKMVEWWRLIGNASRDMQAQVLILTPSVAEDIARDMMRILRPSCRHHPDGCPTP
jgi:hypothetical protein